MIDFEDTYYPDVPPELEAVQHALDSFVEVNYNSALDALGSFLGKTQLDTAKYKSRIIDIIRNNPPLASVPLYCRDGRTDYLWYSDFYDDITKDALQKYRSFTAPTNKITTATYADELVKIDLPYFGELVHLICLEKLCARFDVSELSKEDSPEVVTEITLEPASLEDIPQQIETAEAGKPKPKRPVIKRSYEPRMNDKQYSLLAQCMENIQLFRRPVSVAKLKKLFRGRLPEPLQVTNQKSLVYLFDQLKENGLLKETWISVADGNGDFVSFLRGKNKDRYGSEGGRISGAQFSNRRIEAKSQYIHGLDTIDETIESMVECGDK